ncbi:HIT family protein [Halolactibacillus alkaliphilus]|uniref:HIT family protein n=1 Tax=Halolactibacillus alkaliphilus TaxID=442899 RepID=A0A511X4G6_9BACI|nr:HIT family protein [Halolactibacillus alkaliphilus]GEN57844.1 HIT family protein [Halolactibacillus alkaliphilus]GGN75199.1 HIT family protein [Halolactibacillus alkaliphilus]SFP06355.1 Diadenosine tetraphosphate (Ap4A) hydrolase [Halolactibacillus alkaliphilus]
MSNIISDFTHKFKTDELSIYETEYWLWSLRPVQCTLGAGVLSLKRECSNFSELKQEEFSDLYNVIKVIEDTLKNVFDYDKINYLMLMMIDKQVHYHVIPRYKDEVKFNSKSWIDSGWPGIPNLAGDEADINLSNDIIRNIKDNLAL